MGISDLPSVFDIQAMEYDAWFDRHADLYQKELAALRMALQDSPGGLDIGAGTGRFTTDLGLAVALEPSESMARLAIGRGIPVVKGEAEQLPFHDQSFHVAVMVTSICFLKDIPRAFSEVNRVLDAQGIFIIGMIDRGSVLGRRYEAQKASNPWYRDAHFHSVDEVTRLLQNSGFGDFAFWQTLFPEGHEAADPLPGFGIGSFVVIHAQKI